MRPSRSLIAATLVLLVAGASAAFAPQVQRTAWEYKIVRGPGISIASKQAEIEAGIAQAESALNALGQDGWELVAVDSPYAILRRAR